MKVKNVSGVQRVVPLPLGGDAVVDVDGSLSTSDEHAKSLLEQPANWAPAKDPKPTADVKETN